MGHEVLILRTLDLAHRWAGGLLGLLLAVIAFSGVLLIHKHAWIGLPGSGDPPPATTTHELALASAVLARAKAGDYLVMPSEGFGLAQLVRPDSSGAYFGADGRTVKQWHGVWDRPELWLFDLHHHLLLGDAGETVIGIAGLAVILFVISGTVLWWRTRRTFRLRVWPARWTRPAIVMHHRDLGIVMAPLLLLVALTGAMMIFRPVAGFVLAPLSPPQVIAAALEPPEAKAGAMPVRPDWRAIVAQAQTRFPDARLRIVSLPREAGKPVTVRMKQPAEWLPNGRSTVWLDPAAATMLASRDALAVPRGAQVFNMVYPLHAAKVGGLTYGLVMTGVGLALILLGLLTSWSFWFRRKPKRD